MANSSIFNFPKLIKCSCFSFSTTLASYGDTKFASILEAQVVFIPLVQILSFIPIGIPAKSPVILPSSIPFCMLLACSKASSVKVVIKACTSSSFSCILFT